MPKGEAIPFEVAFRAAAHDIGFSVLAIDNDSALVARETQTVTVGLGNIRSYLAKADPSKQEKVLARFINALLQTDILPVRHALSDVRTRLLPRVSCPFPTERPPPPSRPVVSGQLDVFLVVEEGDTLWYVTQQDLDEWSSDFSILLETALANLRLRSPAENWRAFASYPNIRLYGTGDPYGASRMLLLKDLFQPWPTAGILVGIPARDVLMCTRFDQTNALDAVGQLSDLTYRSHLMSPYKVSDQLYWFDGEQWEGIGIHRAGGSTSVFPSIRLATLMRRMLGS